MDARVVGRRVEVIFGVLGEVDRRDANHQAGVGELGDALGQDHAVGIGFALVPAGVLQVTVGIAETGDVGRAGQVGRHYCDRLSMAVIGVQIPSASSISPLPIACAWAR